jgi:hypothetical protein
MNLHIRRRAAGRMPKRDRGADAAGGVEKKKKKKKKENNSDNNQ